MLARVSEIPNPRLSDRIDLTMAETYLVVRRWKQFHPHISEEIENIELLSADGTLVMFYNMFNDAPWIDIWCRPGTGSNYRIDMDARGYDD
jgi:hypothetical protein